MAPSAGSAWCSPKGVGLGTTGVALFMSAALVGGTLFQVPFGRLSDRIDRRKVLMLACLLAVLAGAVLALAGEARGGALIPAWLARIAAMPAVLIGAVMVFGGCIYSMYSLCVAHTNDFVEREDFVEASSGLLLTWALGATLGPIVAGPLMQWLGLGGLFLYAAVVHLLFIAVHLVPDHARARRCRPRRAPTSSRPATPGPRTCWRRWTRARRSRRPPEPQASSDASSAPREAMK